MNRSLLVGVSLAVALAASMSSADADIFKKKRKPSFLQQLFGSFEGNSRDRNLRKRNQQEWWQLEDDGVRIIREPNSRKLASATRKAAASTAFVDPEVAEGFGLGNLVYSLPKFVAVVDPAFSKLQTTETAASAIRLVLSEKSTEIRATDTIRKAVLDHYKSSGFKPLWTEAGRLTPRGDAVKSLLAVAADEGLNPDRYLPGVLTGFADANGQIAGDSFAAAQLDVGLTVAALTYARHISGGAFEPERLSRYHDIKPEYAEPETALKVLAYSPFPAEYLKGLAPSHPSYAAFKAELQRLNAAAGPDTSFPEGKRVKVTQKDPRVVLLRSRLAEEGFVPSNAAEITAETEAVLDKHLSKVLKAYQKAKAIPQTGHLDQHVVRALSGDSPQAARDRLIVNMERLRWLPKDLGRRHVFVNQASYTVDVRDNGQSVWTSKVIVGRPTTQTSVFSDTMETVVFNPTWGMPQSILINEYLTKLRRDPGYFDRKGYQVVNASGKRVRSSSVNWHGVGSNSGIGVVQPAGSGNALGELKFLFPNAHSIYMHDTPNRELFAEAVRNFSHGCVRVENPREFAQTLLKWDAEKVDAMVDRKATANVKLEDQVRVHLAYLTAWPDDSGKIQYFSDAYGRDASLVQALRLTEAQFGRSKPAQLVQNAGKPAVPAID